ncbi:MAG TPA: chemotaxis protein CheR, partial [Planctomycetaceae bacterium]|nr:chemotaxis protein CheR [Planctomycetaceae bacterium]
AETVLGISDKYTKQAGCQSAIYQLASNSVADPIAR